MVNCRCSLDVFTKTIEALADAKGVTVKNLILEDVKWKQQVRPVHDDCERLVIRRYKKQIAWKDEGIRDE